MSGTVVESFGSGLLRTEIWTDPTGRYLWRRDEGPLAPAPFAVPTEALTRALNEGGARAGGPVGTVVAEPAAGVREYRAPGPVSVADALLAGTRIGLAPADRLVELLRGLGRCLRALHALPVLPEAPGSTRGLRRLGDWLDGRAATEAGQRSHARMVELLGAGPWGLLVEWHRAVLADPERVPVHGAPGLGSVVAETGLTHAVLLCGEDVGHAPWYTDLGWVLGELTELASSPAGAGMVPWSALVDALRDGYGRELDARVNRMAALRIALHAHDFLCYGYWSDEECARYAGLLGTVVLACGVDG